jgi:hypothetical protein
MSRATRPIAWLLLLVLGVVVAPSSPAGPPEKGGNPGTGQASTAVGQIQPATTGAANAKTRGPGGIIISRETTFITGPLCEDGSVDYLAAINERYSRGVTPENNAVVALLQAVGPGVIAKPVRERFFQMLGVAMPSEEGPYFVDFETYFLRKRNPSQRPRTATQRIESSMQGIAELMKEGLDANSDKPAAPKREPSAEETASTQWFRIIDEPWRKDEFPIAAGWLEANRKPLDLMVAATKRPRFYAPLPRLRPSQEEIAADPFGWIEAVWPMTTIARREWARALRARAMFHIGEGKAEEAWQDLLACHRLVRLADQGSLDIFEQSLVRGIEEETLRGDVALVALAEEGKLTAEQGRRFAAAFRSLPPLAKSAEKLDWGERLVHLEAVYAAAGRSLAEPAMPPITNPLDRLSALLRGDSGEPATPKPVTLGQRVSALLQRGIDAAVLGLFFDGDDLMRQYNGWLDRTISALSKPTPSERDAAVEKLEREIMEARSNASAPRAILRASVQSGSFIGGVRRQLNLQVAAGGMLGPTFLTIHEDVAAGWQVLVPVVFALAAYRADHGAYPADLAALVPKYLPAVPKDPFSDGPIRYRPENLGYVVYCVGANGKDDGGRGEWGLTHEHFAREKDGWDDVAIQVPPKKEE